MQIADFGQSRQDSLNGMPSARLVPTIKTAFPRVLYDNSSTISIFLADESVTMLEIT